MGSSQTVTRVALLLGVIAAAAIAFFWFWPTSGNEERLALLQADATLELPELEDTEVTLVGTQANVASRSWTGTWDFTYWVSDYTLEGRDIENHIQVLFDHIDDSDWIITNAQCTDEQLSFTAQQSLDGDWATLEMTGWDLAETSRLIVRSTIGAAGGDPVVPGEPRVDPIIQCPALG